MAAVIETCNICLTSLEDEPIQRLGDSKGGVLCDRVFDGALLSVLRLRPWSMNAKRASLSKLVAAPAFQYDYQYQLPADFLDLRDVLAPVTFAPLANERVIEGGKILTSIPAPLYIKYGRRISRNEYDGATIDPLFMSVVAFRIGTIIAKALTGEQGDAERMEIKFQREFLDAAAVDANDQIRHRAMDVDDWTDVNA